MRQSGHLKLTHVQLFNGTALVDETFSLTHPTRKAELFSSRDRAEDRFDELTGELG